MDDAAHSRRPGAGYLTFAAVLAFAICLVLQFSAAGKLLGPNPRLYLIEPSEAGGDGLLRDTVIAGVELLIVVLLAFLHRWKYAWPLVALFFAGLLGYSAHALVTGRDCGCFGDLWTPPKGLTSGLNAAFILGAMALMLMSRMSRAMVVVTLVLCAGAAGAGYYQATQDNPDPKLAAKGLGIDPVTGEPLGGATDANGEQHTAADGDENAGGPAPRADRPRGVLGIPELESIMAAPRGQLLGYVFLHEHGCNTCEQFLPFIEIEAEEYAAQGMPIEVVVVEITELSKDHGIPREVWHTTPTVLAIDGGEVVYYDRGEDIKLPSELLDPWLAGEGLGGRDRRDDQGG